MALSKIQGAQIQTPVDISTVNITGVGTITNGTITNLTGTAGTVTTLRSTTLNADTGNIVTGVTTNFTSTNGSITNLTGTAGTVTTLRSTTLNADTGNIVTGVTTNFTSTNVVITGVTTVSAGTSSLPSISPSGDPNTGVFFPSADHLNFSTGGTSRVQIESDGDINIDGGGVFYDATNNRLAIGTTSPGFKLDVASASGSATVSQLSFTGGNSVFLKLANASNAQGFIGYETQDLTFYTNNTEKLRIDSSGRLLIGTSSVINNAYGGTVGSFQVSKDEYLPIGFFSFTSNPADGYCPYLELHRARGTKASPTIVSSGDELGEINFYGYDGSTFRRGASIRSYVDAAPGSDDMPSRLTFYTSADGSATPTERMRLDSSGNLKFNSGYGSVTTAFGCRAWVNFNGSGTPAINGSGNVSSITDVSAGYYVVNFTSSMPDANYAAVVTTGTYGIHILGTVSTSGCQIQIGYVSSLAGGVTLGDVDGICAAFFR